MKNRKSRDCLYTKEDVHYLHLVCNTYCNGATICYTHNMVGSIRMSWAVCSTRDKFSKGKGRMYSNQALKRRYKIVTTLLMKNQKPVDYFKQVFEKLVDDALSNIELNILQNGVTKKRINDILQIGCLLKIPKAVLVFDNRVNRGVTVVVVKTVPDIPIPPPIPPLSADIIM